MVRTPCRAASAASARVLSPLPRRMTSGIRPGWLTSARAESCPGTRSSWIMAGSSPATSSAGAMTSSASAMAERIAAEPVRSTPALRDLTNWEAMSTTTFGRASKLAPITPTGMRRSVSSRPPGSSLIVRWDGSAGTSASARSWPAMSSSRAGVQPQPVEQRAGDRRGLARPPCPLRWPRGPGRRGGPAPSAIARSAPSRRSSGTTARSANGVPGGPGRRLHGLGGLGVPARSSSSAVIGVSRSLRLARTLASGYATGWPPARSTTRAAVPRHSWPGRVADGEPRPARRRPRRTRPPSAPRS